MLTEQGKAITGMVSLEVPAEELVTRLLERGKTSGRADDRDGATIARRIAEYESKTAPVKTYYAKQGKWRGVNGVGDIATITERLVKAIG
jgi:adenylate kinase